MGCCRGSSQSTGGETNTQLHFLELSMVECVGANEPALPTKLILTTRCSFPEEEFNHSITLWTILVKIHYADNTAFRLQGPCRYSDFNKNMHFEWSCHFFSKRCMSYDVYTINLIRYPSRCTSWRSLGIRSHGTELLCFCVSGGATWPPVQEVITVGWVSHVFFFSQCMWPQTII